MTPNQLTILGRYEALKKKIKSTLSYIFWTGLKASKRKARHFTQCADSNPMLQSHSSLNRTYFPSTKENPGHEEFPNSDVRITSLGIRFCGMTELPLIITK